MLTLFQYYRHQHASVVFTNCRFAVRCQELEFAHALLKCWKRDQDYIRILHFVGAKGSYMEVRCGTPQNATCSNSKRNFQHFTWWYHFHTSFFLNSLFYYYNLSYYTTTRKWVNFERKFNSESLSTFTFLFVLENNRVRTPGWPASMQAKYLRSSRLQVSWQKKLHRVQQLFSTNCITRQTAILTYSSKNLYSLLLW